jgi:hypothetical protein
VRSPLHRCLAAVALALGLTGAVSAQEVAPKESPFQPAPYQFTGVSLEDGSPRVCIFAAKDQRSRWIRVGATVDGIQVVHYDREQQRVMIAVDGSNRELALQRGVASAQVTGPAPDVSFSADPAAAPAASILATPTAPTASDAAKAATLRDDRMLVSDLLEIGMEQRQAYATAQKAQAATPPADSK